MVRTLFGGILANLQESEIADALRGLDLDLEVKPKLAACVLQLSDAIEFERVRAHERTPDARAAQKNYLRNASKQIDRLWELIRSSDSPNIATFNALTSEVIGRYLSNRSFEQLGVPTSSLAPSDRDLGFRPPIRESTYDWHEQAAISNRQSFAERDGGSALGLVLLRVRERLDRQYELMNDNKGGAPGNAYRRLAIRQLADVFAAAPINPATATAGSLFVKVCAAAFPLLGIDDKGLEKAVDRELRKWREKPVRRNPP